LVIAVDTTPVSTLVAVTPTPGINALALSETVPLRLALLDWLNAGADRAKNTSATARQDLCMISSPLSWGDYIPAEVQGQH
jgi:hypothetical protein